MDRLKANRVGNGLFFLRDWIDRRAGVPLPWATKKGALDLMGVKLRAIRRHWGPINRHEAVIAPSVDRLFAMVQAIADGK